MNPSMLPDLPADAEIAATLPLLRRPDRTAMLAWHAQGAVTVDDFLAELSQLAPQLPAAAALNLAEERYHFTLLFCALLLRGQVNLLPPSRSPATIAATVQAFPGCVAVDDDTVRAAQRGTRPCGVRTEMPQVDAGVMALVAYTSGSSGEPRGHPRHWAQLCMAHAGSRQRLQAWFGPRFSVVATVPPQHMYGLEFTVLLPLQAEVAVHAGRPLFPADIAAALAVMPAPRVLVTTPLHLRHLLVSGVTLPPLAGIMSATAPLDLALAAQAETRWAVPVYEIFGSTETCAIATRRSVVDEWWQPMPGVSLSPAGQGCLVSRSSLPEPLWLGDLIEMEPGSGRFRVLGRQHDLLDIAGKRMSLAALNQYLASIPGVEDAVVFQQPPDEAGVGRMAALVVAPTLDPELILAQLRQQVDPVFLPRPLRKVPALPRNATGKLPRQDLLMLLRQEAGAASGRLEDKVLMDG